MWFRTSFGDVGVQPHCEEVLHPKGVFSNQSHGMLHLEEVFVEELGSLSGVLQMATNQCTKCRHLIVHATCPLCGVDEEETLLALAACLNVWKLSDAMGEEWSIPRKEEIAISALKWLFHVFLNKMEVA